MNPQDMFTCGAAMALALSGYVTTAGATPVDPSSGVTVSHVDANEGSTLMAAKDAKNHAPPQTATARCKDGTLSYSQHRQDACLHHHGIAKVLIDDPDWGGGTGGDHFKG